MKIVHKAMLEISKHLGGYGSVGSKVSADAEEKLMYCVL